MTRTTMKRKKHPVVETATLEDLQKEVYFNWPNRGRPADEPPTDWYEVENKWRDNIVPENND